MNIGLFGGTFDPIHKGHLALAKAARERCDLGKVYFVPTNMPPHRTAQPVASYFHRYAMTALATQGEKALVASLLEAPGEFVIQDKKNIKASFASAPNYSIDTIRKLKQSLKEIDRLFFLIGIDAFKDIAKWREAEALFSECEFIIASRPGFSLADVAAAPFLYRTLVTSMDMSPYPNLTRMRDTVVARPAFAAVEPEPRAPAN